MGGARSDISARGGVGLMGSYCAILQRMGSAWDYRRVGGGETWAQSHPTLLSFLSFRAQQERHRRRNRETCCLPAPPRRPEKTPTGNGAMLEWPWNSGL